MNLSADSKPSTSTKALKCPVPGCSASFSKNRKLISHIRTHTGERPFICDEPGCDKTYTNSSHLIRHKKINHSEKNPQRVVCEFEGCGLILANKYSLKKHYNRKHNLELYPFKCNECSQGFHRKRQLQQHSYLHTGLASFSCDKCDLNFTTSYFLNKHKRSHRTYSCDCGEVFHRWTYLLSHRKLCRRGAFKCTICQRTFARVVNFMQHNVVHKKNSEKLVFTCPYKECQRQYSYKRNLHCHINTFHRKMNYYQSFKCTYPKCTVVLKTKQSFKKHVHQHFFKWTQHKSRQTRCDKGKPKKTILSILLGNNSRTENKENISNNNTSAPELDSDNDNTTVTFNNEEILDDNNLLEQCDVTLKLLNEKLVVAS